MKNILSRLSYIGLLISIISSCQSKEGKQINNSVPSENNVGTLYTGKWFSINKEGNKYYHCTDDDRFFQIDKDKIYDHTAMEDSNFNIDHTKNKGNQTFFYIDKQESSYYILNWVDKNKGIISYQFNNYKPSLFIADKEIKNIENKTCQPKTKSCDLNNLSSKYKFKIEAGEYKNEKEQKYPISAWIIITDKKSAKSQEIHFEPNSWSTYADLPCNSFFVKDFNFDGLEDFAIVWDEGGNAGKLYEYYFQDKNGNFSPTDSFPLQHGMLAEDIDVTKKIITSQGVVGCCHININKYKLNTNGNWETSSEQQELKKK
jgi:hypothetical protein